jgi:hypothetical protein
VADYVVVSGKADHMRKSKSIPDSTSPTTARDDSCAPDRRDHHGDRSVPPPLAFDIYALPDSTLLTLRDVAAHCRVAVATVQKWRGRRGHPLRWLNFPGGFLRTTVGELKAFLAPGKPRPSLTPPPSRKPEQRSPKAARRSSRRRADDQPEAASVP